MPKAPWIGQSVERLEDPPLVAGRGEFAGDINFPHQLHMRIVRSAHAHGRIVSIDATAARALPGVFAVWTADDVADMPPIDFREGSIPALDPYRQPILANGCVRYVGEPVAAVFADDPYIAEDAADLVDDGDRGTAAGARCAGAAVRILAGPRQRGGIDPPGLWRRRRRVPRPPRISSRSSLRSAGIPACRWKRAARSAATTPRAAFWNCTAPPRCRTAIRNCCRACSGIPPSASMSTKSHVGGGFGIRGEIYPEDVLVCVAAKRFNAPVKWIEDRREHLIAANHSRQQMHKIRAAVDDDGVILAIDDVYFHDQGAYVRTHATRVVHMTAGILPGPYRVPAYRSVGHFRLTNKTPAATYRAPGRYETTFVRERLVDAIADAARHRPHRDPPPQCHRAGRNALPRPLEALGEEIHYDTGDYIGLLDKLFAEIGWDELNADVEDAQGQWRTCRHRRRHVRRKKRPRSDRRREDFGRHIRRGRGRHRRRFDRPGLRDGDGAGRRRRARRRLPALPRDPRPDRSHRLRHRRARLARHGDDRVGDAYRGAERAQEGARSRRANCCRRTPDALDIVDGEVVRRDRSGGPSISLGKIAQHLAPTRKTLSGRDPGLSAEGWFRTEHQVYPYGSHVAVVRVDRETGGVRWSVFHRLRYRPRHQSGAGRGPDRRRLRAGIRRRAVRGIHLQRTRRSACRHLRRLSAARRPRDAGARSAVARGLHHAAQSARHQGRRRKRHHRGRRRHRVGDRRRHRHSGRGDAASGDAAAAQTAFEQTPGKLIALVAGTAAYCEEQSDEAIQGDPAALNCFASLGMTRARQSTLMPANLMTFAHFSVSRG